MRKFYLFWILVFLASISFAQYFHFAEHRRYDHIQSMVCINQKSFYLERIDLPNTDILNLAGVDSSGIPFLKKPLLNSSSNFSLTAKRVIGTLDKHLVCFYRSMHSCDVTGGTNYLSKLDTNGNFVFTTTLTAFPVDLIQYTDSSYYVMYFNGIGHYSKNGTFISSLNLTGSLLKCVSRLNSGNLFLSGTTAYYELDTALNVVQIVPTNTLLSKFVQTSSGRSYGISQSGELIKYASNFSVLTQSQLTGIVISDFVCRNDSFFSCGYYNVNKRPYYAILDSTLNPLYQTTNTLTDITPLAIGISNNNQINITALANQVYPVSIRAFFRFSKTGDFALQQNIGVSSFTASSLVELGSGYYKGDFEVEVKNYGNQIANGFNLNTDFFLSICPYSWQKWFDTLVPIGGSVIVHTGTLNLFGNLNGGSSNHKDYLCFYTSTPGKQADYQISNDKFCDSAAYSPVGLPESVNIINRIQIFPNPFSSQIQIQSDVDMKEIELYNTLGVLLKKMTVATKNTEIEWEDLLTGIYFLKVETVKGTITNKIIKE